MEERERLYGVELGNAYLGYSRREDIDTAAARRLLVKGLRYCPWHEEIIKAIQSQFDSDFSDIENRIKEAPDDVMTVIDSWLSDLSFYKELKKCLDPERMGELYALYGRILMIKESFEEAERKFSKALEHNSENPYFHVLIADAYFAQDKYNLGVMHLNKAVELDRSYGRCWEDIGDALFDQTQYGDALSAYEMCFKATPENHMALKKMGDCYQQLGKPEAAKEAHKQYERLIQKSSS